MSTIQHLILLLFVCGASTYAEVSRWEALTVKAPECEVRGSCKISQSNGEFEITLSPVVKEGRRHLKQIQIRNLASRKVQKFDVPEMNNLASDEIFKLYKIKLRPTTKDFDLALHAFNSAREGEVFYYFVYDPKGKQFVMSEGTLPKLKYDSTTKQYLSELQGSPYVLESNLKLSSPR